MTTYVGLLRAVNVAGQNRIQMAELRAMLLDLGAIEPHTLLQSGNVVFGSPNRSRSRLEGELEKGLAEKLGVRTDVFLRTADEWADVVGENPFPIQAVNDPGHLLVLLLRGPAVAGGEAAARRAIPGRESLRVVGDRAYIVYPDGVGRSRLTLPLLERTLGARGTARNWNTVLKLEGLARPRSEESVGR
jgi:uncharacterized protein (DUF1697 family)